MHIGDPPNLQSLGDPSLRFDGPDGDHILLDLGKPLALVTYLACAPGRTAGREHLVDLLWSDLDRDAGRHGLRQALWHIRKRVGDRFVVAERESVTLIGALHFDRDDLLTAADVGDLECVATRYTGEFFPGFATPGSGEFERWAELERARLRSLFVRCIERLVRRRLHEGRAREAIELAKRARDVEPLRQTGWHLLLEALIAASDTLAAAVEADALERLLREEEIEQEPATRALLNQARQPSSVVDRTQPAVMVAELVGREREFATLLDAWKRVRPGRALSFRIMAPAGLGKTRLLTDVAARLRSMRARPIYVRANPGARDVPYSLASSVASALAELPGARGIAPSAARALVSLDPRLEKHYPASAARPARAPDELRHRLLAMRELIAAVANEQALALFVDDLHWADAASRQLLTGAFGALQHEPVLFVVAERSRSFTDPSLPNAVPVPLAPLSPAAVGELLTSLAALPAEPWAERLPVGLHRATGGSPLLVLETLYLAIERGLLSRGEHGWDTEDQVGLLHMLDEGGATRHRLTQLAATDVCLLSLLACAGAPLEPETMTVAGDIPGDAVDAHLRELESAGFVARAGARWEMAHDEISSRVLEQLPESQRHHRSAAIARALLFGARDDPQRLRFAAQQARMGQDRATLTAALDRFVRHARRRGDWRRTRLLAQDLLGESTSADDAIVLESALPLTVRLGLVTPRRVATAVTGAILLALGLPATVALVRKPPPPPPEAVLAVMVRDQSGLAAFDVPIDSSGWTPGLPITVKARGRPQWHYTGSGFVDFAPQPDHRGSWAADGPVSDSGALELFLLTPDRGTERLTFARGQDVRPSWSPDGTRLVFATGRWNDLEHYDIAILDLATRAVTQLTSGDPTDDTPYWSPDGARIAFYRRKWDSSPNELCVMAASGSRLRCRTLASRDESLRGWLDETTVLLRDDSGYARVDVDAWTRSRQQINSADALLSPDGRWLVCQCDQSSAGTWLVLPAAEPSAGRPVTMDVLERAGVFMTWGSTSSSGRFLHRLELTAGPGRPRVGVTHRLNARGFDATGRRSVPRALTFRASDTTIATVDSLGTIHPWRRGDVVIDASAGGWRGAQVRLSIEDNKVDTLFTEDWASGIGAAWLPFGDPLPAVDTGPGGVPALNNRGDGRFMSGVHSLRGYAVEEGLGFDVALSTPITLTQWQFQEIGFVFGLDSATLFSWDHRTNDPWSFASAAPVTGFCFFRYPGGPEGPSFADSLILKDIGAPAAPAPSSLRSGEWYRLRLQVFPDGRCGAALNGTPMLFGTSVVTAQPTYLFLFGMSVQTKILVGPLTVFSGVRTDVNWESGRR